MVETVPIEAILLDYDSMHACARGKALLVEYDEWGDEIALSFVDYSQKSNA